MCIEKRYKLNIVQVYAPTPSYTEEDTINLYDDVDETLGKPNHYTIECSNSENNKPDGNGQICCVPIEKRKRRHLGRM